MPKFYRIQKEDGALYTRCKRHGAIEVQEGALLVDTSSNPLNKCSECAYERSQYSATARKWEYGAFSKV